MGDRAMAEIKTSDGSFYLYTHWNGHTLPNDAKEAVKKSKQRWDDESYATRIIIDQLTKHDRDKETGSGLMLQPNAEDEYNHDKPSVVIDLTQQTLTIFRNGKNTLKFVDV
jgi:hypothetical protein